MSLSKEERKIIQAKLPYGCQASIASKLGVSRITVYQYLTGARNSERVENAVIEKFKEIKDKEESLKKLIYG